MKILYVGNFQPAHSTETHLAATFENLGCQVIRIQENEIMPRTLLRDAETHRPDIMLWTRTWPGFVSLNTLKELKKLNILSVSYHLDLYMPISRKASVADDPFWYTDFVFTPDGDPGSAEAFKSLGINHNYLMPGVYKQECTVGDRRESFAYDVAFVGKTYGYHSEWPYREKLVNFLRQTYGGWFKIYGHPYETVRGKALNDVFASTKVVIGDSLCPNFTHEAYWSDRIYETTGRGGFIIHPRIKGLEKEFRDHEEVAFYNYGDLDHLKELIDWYLKHEDYREQVRKNGMARTVAEHTYHDRIRQMFKIIGGKYEAAFTKR